MRRVLKTSLWAIVVVLSALLVAGLGKPAHALDGDDFQPGKIISDSNFFDSSALSAVQIQQFLESKVPKCDNKGKLPYKGTTRAAYGTAHGFPPPYICLREFKQNVPATAAATAATTYMGKCSAITAASNRTAAQIIDIVSKSCRVSAKVLLVLLQKEQSLVTDDWPTDSQYRKATGFACPDTADCDTEFSGFFKQVYHAARKYTDYALRPQLFNHIAGANNNVRYHPRISCGSKTVFIANQATAGLYNYTPYQPSKSALDNLYGSAPGDPDAPGTPAYCAAYGNRNFWRMYNDWFGSTLADPLPTQTLIGDWDGDGKKTVGLKIGNQFYLDNNNDGDADINFGMGKVTDKAYVGKWHGNTSGSVTTRDTIGLKRGNFYYLDNNNDGDADVHLQWGKASDQAFVGNWDADGRSELGLKRGNTYYLDRDTDARADKKIVIGKVTDQSYIGDWDGDGIDTIGLKRGRDYFLDNNNDKLGDVIFEMGRSSDRVFIGDWDGDGIDTIGLKRENFYYLVDDDDRNDVAGQVHMGKSSDKVIVGNWDVDDTEEIGLQRYNRYYYDTDLDSSSEINFTFNYF